MQQQGIRPLQRPVKRRPEKVSRKELHSNVVLINAHCYFDVASKLSQSAEKPASVPKSTGAISAANDSSVAGSSQESILQGPVASLATRPPLANRAHWPTVCVLGAVALTIALVLRNNESSSPELLNISSAPSVDVAVAKEASAGSANNVQTDTQTVADSSTVAQKLSSPRKVKLASLENEYRELQAIFAELEERASSIEDENTLLSEEVISLNRELLALELTVFGLEHEVKNSANVETVYNFVNVPLGMTVAEFNGAVLSGPELLLIPPGGSGGSLESNPAGYDENDSRFPEFNDYISELEELEQGVYRGAYDNGKAYYDEKGYYADVNVYSHKQYDGREVYAE